MSRPSLRFRRREGGVLLEAIISLTLGLLVLSSFTGALVACVQWTRTLVARAEALEVVRTVWVVLDEELRPGLVARDWTLNGGGIVELRAFRGVARICPDGGGNGVWTVAYRGRRMPDAGRDSLLVLGLDGGWRAVDLERSETGGACDAAPGETVMRWHWGREDLPASVLARVFERGQYHIADGAFRYRSGGGGRQPLTPERLGLSSGFRDIPGGLEVRVGFDEDGGGGGMDSFVWPVMGMDSGAGH